jgi:hypothetical protein
MTGFDTSQHGHGAGKATTIGLLPGLLTSGRG